MLAENTATVFYNSEQEIGNMISSKARDPAEHHVTTFLSLLPAEFSVEKIGPITQHFQVCRAHKIECCLQTFAEKYLW